MHAGAAFVHSSLAHYSVLHAACVPAAVGLSTNLKDLKSMGYKPFVVGFIAMVTVGLVSIFTMKIFTELFL